FEPAIEHGRRTVELDANFFPGYFYLGMALGAKGQHAEAVAALQKATTLSGNSTLMLAVLARAFALCGKDDEARRILLELEDLGRHKYVPLAFVAGAYVGLGEKDRVFNSLELAYQDRCSWLFRCVVSDAVFDGVRDDARFQDLLRRILGRSS